MPQFDVSSFSSQLFWLVTVFGFLYIIVNKFIAPKAETILTARNRFMEENINSAEEHNNKAKILREDCEAKLSEVNTQVDYMKKEAIDTLEALFIIHKEELTLELKNKTVRALAEIKESVDTFHINERESHIDLAAFIIEKITNKSADINLLETIYEKKK